MQLARACVAGRCVACSCMSPHQLPCPPTCPAARQPAPLAHSLPCCAWPCLPPCAGICGTIVSSVCANTPDGTKEGVNASDTWFCSGALRPLRLLWHACRAAPSASRACPLVFGYCNFNQAVFGGPGCARQPAEESEVACPELWVPAPSAPAYTTPADNRIATFLRNLISSTLPAILLSVWQAVVLPIYFYNCAQVRTSRRRCWHPARRLCCPRPPLRTRHRGEQLALHAGACHAPACARCPVTPCVGLPCPRPGCLQASAQYFSLSDLDLACARWFFLVRPGGHQHRWPVPLLGVRLGSGMPCAANACNGRRAI